MSRPPPGSTLFLYTTLFRSPDAVEVDEFADGKNVRLEVRVADSDMGRVIGREGRTIKADRKSTRLNSSHRTNSYAVFCLKKKTLIERIPPPEVCSNN